MPGRSAVSWQKRKKIWITTMEMEPSVSTSTMIISRWQRRTRVEISYIMKFSVMTWKEREATRSNIRSRNLSKRFFNMQINSINRSLQKTLRVSRERNFTTSTGRDTGISVCLPVPVSGNFWSQKQLSITSASNLSIQRIPQKLERCDIWGGTDSLFMKPQLSVSQEEDRDIKNRSHPI